MVASKKKAFPCIISFTSCCHAARRARVCGHVLTSGDFFTGKWKDIIMQQGWLKKTGQTDVPQGPPAQGFIAKCHVGCQSRWGGWREGQREGMAPQTLKDTPCFLGPWSAGQRHCTEMMAQEPGLEGGWVENGSSFSPNKIFSSVCTDWKKLGKKKSFWGKWKACYTFPPGFI